MEAVEEVKKPRGRTKSTKEAAIEAKIAAKIEQLKAEALEEVEVDEELQEANRADWAVRYRCKVDEVSRTGEQSIKFYVNHPNSIRKPYPIQIRLGEWLDEGLPMSVIKRLQSAFDTDSKTKEDHEKTGNAGDDHKMFRKPRFAVQIDKPVEPKKK